MSQIRLIALFFLLCCVASCDNTTEPSRPLDTSGFAIVNAPRDSFYFGEEAWIEVNELGSDTSSLLLFVHTVKMTGLRIEGRKLYFTVSKNTPTGTIRLYKGDLLAKNEFTLNVLPHHINEFATRIITYNPGEAYSGEEIFIFVFDLPLRRREFDVLLNDEVLPIRRWDSSLIVVRIAEGQKDGQLRLRAFDDTLDIGPFKVLQHTGVFLDTNRVSKILIQASALRGSMTTVFTRNDSTFTEFAESPSFYLQLPLQTPATILREDSLYIKASERKDGTDCTVDIALKLDPEKNTVSGRIALFSRTIRVDIDTQWQQVTVKVKDMPWRLQIGIYNLLAWGESISQKATSISYEGYYHAFESSVHGTPEQINRSKMHYEGASDQSYFVVYLTP